MNRVTRLLALAGVGIGVAASVAVGTAPAQAAGQSSTHSASVQTKANWGNDDDYRIEDYFRSGWRCVREGQVGVITGEWDSFACFEVRSNFGRRDVWALVVSDDDDCDWNSYHNSQFGTRYLGDRGGRFGNIDRF